MKLNFKIIKDEFIIMSRELISLILVVLIMYGAASFFFPAALSKAELFIIRGGNFLWPAVFINFFTPYALVTLGILVVFFLLLFRFFAKERAETFGLDTSRPNYLSALRDYFAVIFFSTVSCIVVYYQMSGRYFLPVATLTGVIFAWWAMAVVINIGGFGEPLKRTVKDLLVIAGIVFAGKTLPAFMGYYAYSSPFQYLIEVGMIYAIGPGIGVMAYPGLGITLELSARKSIAFLQSLGITLFMYFSSPFFAALPAFLLLVPYLLVIAIAAVWFLSTGGSYHIGRFNTELFNALIFPGEKNIFLSIVYSPVLYFLAYFQNLVLSAFRHWTGIIELFAFLASLHYRLISYRNRLNHSARKPISFL